MRKHYVDNLRIISVLFLFFYHTAMVFNTFEGFYVHTPIEGFPNAFIMINWTWFMPLMFAIAGISARLSFGKRDTAHFLKERVKRLLIPLISGILLVVPAQTFFAEKFHNGYTGGYFAQYALFFGKMDRGITGYNGGFTPAQLWFILYLLIISLIALPIIIWYEKRRKLDLTRIKPPVMIALFLIPFAMQVLLDVGGKSMGEYFSLYMLGYFVLSDDNVVEKLEKNGFWLLAAAILLSVGNYVLYGIYDVNSIACDVIQSLASWLYILGFLGLGKRFLNKKTKFTAYFNPASFPIYIFHQSWLVAAAYYAVKIQIHPILQAIIIIISSFCLTIATYEITKRFKLTRFLFGIKYNGGKTNEQKS